MPGRGGWNFMPTLWEMPSRGLGGDAFRIRSNDASWAQRSAEADGAPAVKQKMN